MAYTDIDDPTINFNTVTYTGNVDESSSNGSQAITGVGFQPDWVWIKPRTLGYAAGSHNLTDSVRGAGVGLFADLTAAEYDYGTSANGGTVTAFGSDGFTLGGASQVNEDSNTYVAWNWKAGTSFSNDASATGVGTIDSTGSINTTAGFSIISYSGTGTAGTIAHGLGSTPKMIIVKVRNFATNWLVQHGSIASTKVLYLDAANAETTDGAFNDTLPTSSVFSVKTANGINASGKTYIAYCFSDVKGYLKIGKYEGNANADGTFVYTGFLPAWVMVKNIDAAENWIIFDNKRPGYNLTDALLKPNLSNAESTSGVKFDLLSNGFKARVSDAEGNSSNTFIYMAFAQSPFVNSNGVPTNAR